LYASTVIREAVRKLAKNLLGHLFSGSLFLNSSELRYILGVNAILANRSGHKELKILSDAEVSVFSQWGEDGILDFLLQSFQISKPRILEIGAGDFSECNSRFAIQYRNCSAYLVDAREDLKKNLEKSFSMWKGTVCAESVFVTPENINEIFERANNFMGGIEVLSIDIDGIDYWVAQQLDWSNINIAIVEYNPLFGQRYAVSVPLEDYTSRFEQHYSGLYFGASLRAWIELMEENNLVFLGSNRIGNNAFFVKKKLCVDLLLPIPDTNDLSAFVDWRIRDSRNRDGNLTHLNLAEMQSLLSGLPVVDVRTMTRLPLCF
jgi:hypothetical protein